LRLGVPRVPFWQDLDPEVLTVMERALRRLRAMGVVLVEVDIPEVATGQTTNFIIRGVESKLDIPAYLAAEGTGFTFECARDGGHRAAHPGREQRPERVRRLMIGAASAADSKRRLLPSPLTIGIRTFPVQQIACKRFFDAAWVNCSSRSGNRSLPERNLLAARASPGRREPHRLA